MLVYLLTDGHTLSTIPHDLSSFIHHELISNPEQIFFLLGLLAFYLIPTLLIYLGIQCWYRRFLAEYEKLPSTEQKELLKKLCDNFETGQPVVIYTEHCFRHYCPILPYYGFTVPTLLLPSRQKPPAQNIQ